MINKNNPKAKGLHDLICVMLRGMHFENMSEDQIKSFIYQAGVALHNIPFNVAENKPLLSHQLLEINRLDPDGDDDNWGSWVKIIAGSFEQDLPPKP